MIVNENEDESLICMSIYMPTTMCRENAIERTN